jgi:hypothetical protein
MQHATARRDALLAEVPVGLYPDVLAPRLASEIDGVVGVDEAQAQVRGVGHRTRQVGCHREAHKRGESLTSDERVRVPDPQPSRHRPWPVTDAPGLPGRGPVAGRHRLRRPQFPGRRRLPVRRRAEPAAGLRGAAQQDDPALADGATAIRKRAGAAGCLNAHCLPFLVPGRPAAIPVR